MLHHVAHSTDVPETPSWLSAEGKDFLARCLVRDPAKRWTAEQLLEHPFVSSAASNPTPNSKAAQIEHRVSPKSILDQRPWEDTSTDSDTTVCDGELGRGGRATTWPKRWGEVRCMRCGCWRPATAIDGRKGKQRDYGRELNGRVLFPAKPDDGWLSGCLDPRFF
uniref:Protein kinase domain-containing protein n=1 Tax=Oryza brachyantha TaxID=4533 RepID=J3LCB1_ORYBR